MIYKKSKILFIGTVEFSYRALSALIENKFDIVGVLTKSESNFNSDYYDLTPLAKANNIPIFYRTKDNQDEIISFINSKNPDIIYCFGWSHILPKIIISIPKNVETKADVKNIYLKLNSPSLSNLSKTR